MKPNNKNEAVAKVNAYKAAVAAGAIPCAPLNNVVIELKKVNFINELKADGYKQTVKFEPLHLDETKNSDDNARA